MAKSGELIELIEDEHYTNKKFVYLHKDDENANTYNICHEDESYWDGEVEVVNCIIYSTLYFNSDYTEYGFSVPDEKESFEIRYDYSLPSGI